MTHPIDVAVLADYWLAALSPSDEEVVEQHLLECDACGSRLREIIALADGIRRLARTGSLRMIVSDAFVSRAADEGLQVREYSSAPGGSVYCTVTADDDLLIARLTGDVSGVARLDLAFCDAQGVEQRRLPDIPVRAGAPSVLYQESMAFAKAAPDNTMIVRLLGIDDGGREHLVGEYTFHHTRSLPGPGEW
ncbi:MAG: hypothetical protein DMF90_00790 [Acidobacteria bacterium]|nr:MAG: hypothetical protein DMF90_00790 [Acidobacteriota bacterium]